MPFTNEVEIINAPNVAVTNFPAVQPVSDNGGSLTVDGPLTDTELRATAVPVSGPLTDAQLRATPVPVTEGGAASATVSRVAVSTTVATLAASNASRLKLIIHNETGTLFVKFGATASSADYTYRLTANSSVDIGSYTGEVTGTKATGASFAQVTEI